MQPLSDLTQSALAPNGYDYGSPYADMGPRPASTAGSAIWPGRQRWHATTRMTQTLRRLFAGARCLGDPSSAIAGAQWSVCKAGAGYPVTIRVARCTINAFVAPGMRFRLR